MNVSKKDILYALGGLIKRYENGGTTPTEKERGETLAEKRAREAAGDAAFGDWSGRDARDRTPLTQDQIDLAFKGWPDNARKLAISMYEGGLLDGKSFAKVKQKGEPLDLQAFNKYALKDGDASKGYSVQNLQGEYRRLFKKDGSYQLKDRKVGTLGQNVKNELIARGVPIGDLKNVTTNVFRIGTEPSKYYGDVPVEDEVIEDEVVETTPPEDLTPVPAVQAEPTPVVRKRIEPEAKPEEEVIEEDDDVQVVVRKKLPASGINLGSDLPRSDRLGMGDLPTQSEMGLYGENIRPVEGGIKLIKKPTNEKGGRLYDKGGKMPKALLAYFMKKQKQNMAGGGLFRVMKR